MTDLELIESRKRLEESCGPGMANAVFGFGDDWLGGFMPQSATDKVLSERIDRDFSSHTVGMDKDADMNDVRSKAKAFALDIVTLCPDGRERSLALTKLQEVVFWADASIARSE